MKFRTAMMFLALTIGCHSFSADTKMPNEVTNVETDTGWFSSESDSKTTEVSDYKVCLDENEGYPDAEKWCQDYINDWEPGTPTNYTYGWYGYQATSGTPQQEIK